MEIKATPEDVAEAIARVQHPEIARSLEQLGMIRDLHLDPQERHVTLTLVLPMLQIPISVREYMINSLRNVLDPLDLTLDVQLNAMDDAQRATFFEQSSTHWKA